MQTLDQKYSVIIHAQVLEIKKDPDYKKYGAMSHKLPILIHTAGLAQALAFVKSRGNPIQQRLLEHLAITLGYNDAEVLLQTMQQEGLQRYMLLTRQVLAALLWYKRFAQSILDVDVTEAANVDVTELP